MKKEERKLECIDFDLFSKDALKIYGDSLLITTQKIKLKKKVWNICKSIWKLQKVGIYFVELASVRFGIILGVLEVGMECFCRPGNGDQQSS